MDRDEVAEALAKPISQELLASSIPARLAYVGGAARLETVDGVPDAFIQASRKVTPAEQFEDRERGTRALYDQMVLITVEPDWAKLPDFDTTLPEAVEDLVRAQQDAQ